MSKSGGGASSSGRGFDGGRAREQDIMSGAAFEDKSFITDDGKSNPNGAKKLLEWLRSTFPNYDNELSLSASQAIDNYTQDGFQTINSSLRNSKGEPSSALFMKVAALDSAMRPIPQNITLWRGMNLPGDKDVNLQIEGRKALGEIKLGHTMQDHGYVSTTLDKLFASTFAHTFGNGIPIIAKINVPKGTPVIPVDARSMDVGEWEMILPRGSRFNIRSVERSVVNGRTVSLVTTDYLPPEKKS